MDLLLPERHSGAKQRYIQRKRGVAFKTCGKNNRDGRSLFKVLDIYESYIDPETELPVKSIRNIHEGRYRRYNVVLFDHKTRADSSILQAI